MVFDPKKSKIAITIPHFKLLAGADSVFDRYSEPYIVSLAVDEKDTKALELEFNLMPFPKVRKGATVRMLGDGHLLYGPANPGEFVAMSVLVMESDRDMRKLGDELDGIVKSKANGDTLRAQERPRMLRSDPRLERPPACRSRNVSPRALPGTRNGRAASMRVRRRAGRLHVGTTGARSMSPFARRR